MSYRQYNLGSLKEVKEIVAKLAKKFPGRYKFEKTQEDRKGMSYWLFQVSDDKNENVDCGVVVVLDNEVLAIGDDVYGFLKEEFEKVLQGSQES